MEIIVSRNPSDVCMVSAVPTACGGTDSVTRTLNCAESAMTKNPQARAIGIRRQSLPPKAEAEGGGAAPPGAPPPRRDPLAPPPISDDSTPHAPDSTDSDGAKRNERRERVASLASRHSHRCRA